MQTIGGSDPKASVQPFRVPAAGNDVFATNQLHFVAIGIAFLAAISATEFQKLRNGRMKEILLLSGLSRRILWACLFTLHTSMALAGCFLSYGIIYGFDLRGVRKAPFTLFFLEYLCCAPAVIMFGYFFALLYPRKYKGDSIPFFIAQPPVIPWAIVVFAIPGQQITELEFLFTLLVPSFGGYRVTALFSIAVFNNEEIVLEDFFAWESTYPQILLAQLASFMFYTAVFIVLEFKLYRGLNCCKPKVVAVAPGEAFATEYYYDTAKNANDVLSGQLPSRVPAFPQGVSSDNDLVITSRDVSKSFNRRFATKKATFGVKRGSMLGLLGPNGAGKTTLIKCISGLDEYEMDSGDATVNGYSVVSDLAQARVFMGVCPQFDSFMQFLTARELLTFIAGIRGVQDEYLKPMVELFLKELALEPKADSKGKDLSGGNRRRLSIGLACVANPSALFLDEPTTGIDPRTTEQIWDFFLNGASAPHRAVLITTHSMEEADTLCSDIAIMVDASIRTSGTPAELKERFGGGILLTLAVNSETIDDPTKHAEDIAKTVDKEALCVYSDVRRSAHVFKFVVSSEVQWKAVFTILNEAPELYDFGISQKSLEDVFVQLAGLQQSQ